MNFYGRILRNRSIKPLLLASTITVCAFLLFACAAPETAPEPAVAEQTQSSAITVAGPETPQPEPDANESFQTGGVVCDYLAKTLWDHYWEEPDGCLKLLKNGGMEWVRVGVTTVRSELLAKTPTEQWGSLPWDPLFWSSREYTGEILRQANQIGFKTDLFFFLSDTAAHAGIQDAPKDWQGMDAEETAQRLREYCRETTKYYLDQNISIDLYEIGNEIQMGVLNFRPGERIAADNVDIIHDLDYMKREVWSVEADLLKAAIEGVKSADPRAGIVLHTAGLGISKDNAFLREFYNTMIESGVAFDFIGLSYPYGNINVEDPTRPYFHSAEFVKAMVYFRSLGKDVLFSEFAYPNAPSDTAAPPDEGYPYSPEGQAAWIGDFVSVCAEQKVSGAFYFYPEYYAGFSSGSDLDLSGLLKGADEPMPGLVVFRGY